MLKLKPFALVTLVLVFLTACEQQGQGTLPPMQEALDTLMPDESVDVYAIEVEAWAEPQNQYYVFEPTSVTPISGLIIYPGGKVDFRAYAPTAKAIAAQGYLVALLSSPNDLALFGVKRGKEVINAFPEIQFWSVTGHSLGGTAAAAFGKSNDDIVDGVVIWDSYPSVLFTLKNSDLQAKTIYGTNGGNTSSETFEASAVHLPVGSELVAIEGGVHTFFGYYGDGVSLYHDEDPTDLTREEQQAILVNETVKFLQLLED